MHISLFVPTPSRAPSDSSGYTRRLAAALRAAGTTVDVVELPGQLPLADDPAFAAACAAWDGMDDAALPVIDTLALPAFAGMEDALAARGAIGLVRRPAAMEVSLSDSDREALHRREGRLHARLRRLIAVSDAVADHLARDFGIDRARVVVVPPGTDDLPRSTGSVGPGCEILSVGALVPRKGHDVLLRALARLFDLDWHLTVAGSPHPDPTHAAALTGLVDELNLTQRVRFVDADGDALEPTWRTADLFALATWFDGYGMTIAEALKRGLPVAVCAGGGAASLVEPESGVICEPGDHTQLSKALRRLIFSSSLRRTMGETAWQSGRKLPDWPCQAQAFVRAVTGQDSALR